MWFSSGPILSYNKTLNFVVGNRGGGKSFEATRLSIATFLKKGGTTIWLRRQDTELDEMFYQKFFDDMIKHNKFPDYEFKTKKFKTNGLGYIKRKNTKDDIYQAFIQFMSLSTALKHKSVTFPTVKYIIFDEFIIDKKSNMRYLKNEVFVFLELLQSVMRLREDVRVIFIGNSISIYNPYFAHYGVKALKQEFTVGENYCVQYYKNYEYTCKMKESRFGKLVKDTAYGNYAIENEFYRDSDVFIEKRSKKAYYWYAMKYEDNIISCWYDEDKQMFYICNGYDKNHLMFAFTEEDHTVNTIMVNTVTKYNPIKQLINAYEYGRVRFDNGNVKNTFQEIMFLLT